MKSSLFVFYILFLITVETVAQQNWAAVPCFKLNKGVAIYNIFSNEVNNELILCNDYRSDICGTNYVGVFSYDGNSFHDMDLGVDVQDQNTWLGSTSRFGNCVEYNGKAIITGIFSTVGSNKLKAKSIATWNGAKWDSFPHPFWSNSANQAVNTGFGIGKILKDNGKLWMFTGYDTLQNLTFIPVIYDGTNFTKIPQIPVNTKSQVHQAVNYHNKIVVLGNFFENPSLTYARLAQYDGTSWSPVGTGVRGNLTGAWDMAVYNDTLFIAGNFRKADGNAGNYVMKWDGSQFSDAGFGSWCGYGPIVRLLNYRNRLYAFGGFNCALGKKAYGVAYYENGKWTVPQDSIENGVKDAVIYKDAIYIGGSFNWINGDSTVHQFAKLTCPDFDAASGCLSGIKENSQNRLNLKVFPNPASNKLVVEADNNVKIEKLTFSNALGQSVIILLNPESKQEVDISKLSKGIYFLKAENKKGQSVFKLVKE